MMQICMPSAPAFPVECTVLGSERDRQFPEPAFHGRMVTTAADYHAVAAVGYEGAQYFVKLTAWHGLFRTAADGRQRAIVIEQ